MGSQGSPKLDKRNVVLELESFKAHVGCQGGGKFDKRNVAPSRVAKHGLQRGGGKALIKGMLYLYLNH